MQNRNYENYNQDKYSIYLQILSLDLAHEAGVAVGEALVAEPVGVRGVVQGGDWSEENKIINKKK